MTSFTHWTLRLDGSSVPARDLIGGKAHSVARLMSMGINVPPAFVITTQAHAAYLSAGELSTDLLNELHAGISWLEQQTERTFGRGPSPLLVSVRSGAAISMPGMMDTVLNVGITDDTERALASESGDRAFAHNTHRRFAQLFGHVVLNAEFGELLEDASSEEWRHAIAKVGGAELPQTASDQLVQAVRAVFESWNGRRARRYREHQGISHTLGTAVTVQAMVFGNLDDRSGTGVLFSRNPSTGDDAPFGEYLRRAQGEDVVSGQFTPDPLSTMKESVPEAFEALMEASCRLERDQRDVQDIEFTVERGKLYLLQARAAKLAPRAMVNAAVSMAKSGLIDVQTAIGRVTPDHVRLLMAPQIDPKARLAATELATGEAACPGVGIGRVVADPDEAERRAAIGESVVLARATTSPNDLHGMIAATAIITEEGGATSHAAVVSRALGKACIVGCGKGALDRLSEKIVTVDGQSGKVFEGALDVVTPDEASDPDFAQLTAWARALSPIEVVTSAHAAKAQTLDLSQICGGEDASNLPSIFSQHQGFSGVKGGAVGSDEGVRATVRAGLKFIVAEPALPALLAAAQMQLVKATSE